MGGDRSPERGLMSLTRTDHSQDKVKNYDFCTTNQHLTTYLITLFDTFVYSEEILNGRVYSKLSTKQVSDGLFFAQLSITNFISQNDAVSNNTISSTDFL